jgi:hypothetical protein
MWKALLISLLKSVGLAVVDAGKDYATKKLDDSRATSKKPTAPT